MNIYVPLRTDEYERLQELARVERRPVKLQAAYLIACSLGLTEQTPRVSKEDAAHAVVKSV
ncbi:MAG: hypothetical protein AB7N70_34255 [Dehalococcoidia bacterium]